MSDNYRPPLASLIEAPRPRSLVISVLAGVLAALGAWILLGFVLSLVLAPGATSAEAEATVRRRILSTGHYESIVVATYVVGGLVGGWTAARIGRGRWMACSLLVAGALGAFALVAAFARAGNVGAVQGAALAVLLLTSLAGGYVARAG